MFFKEAECNMNHPLLNIAIQAARVAGKLIARSLDHLEAGDITQKQKQYAHAYEKPEGLALVCSN